MAAQSNSEASIEDLPPIGIALIAICFGGYTIWNIPTTLGSSTAYAWWGILAISVVGGLYVIIGFYNTASEKGILVAFEWLFDPVGESKEAGGNQSSETEKTPPAPESLRNELYFERADRRCEWCDDEIDYHEVHHINPRSEGGSNDPKNLIVLCPNCHNKADNGVVSRSKLKYRVQEQMENRV